MAAISLMNKSLTHNSLSLSCTNHLRTTISLSLSLFLSLARGRAPAQHLMVMPTARCRPQTHPLRTVNLSPSASHNHRLINQGLTLITYSFTKTFNCCLTAIFASTHHLRVSCRLSAVIVASTHHSWVSRLLSTLSSPVAAGHLIHLTSCCGLFPSLLSH